MRIGGIQKLSLCDYPGTVAAVVFTQGCNFNCPFCHNRQLIPLSIDNQPVPLIDIVWQYLKERQQYLEGIVISGGEPTIQKALPDFLEGVRGLGYRIKLDTNGSRPKMVHRLVKESLVDYIAMDIKAPFASYSKLSGCTVEINSIQESMELISASGIPHQFRTTWVKNLLTAEDIREIKTLIPDSSAYFVQNHV